MRTPRVEPLSPAELTEDQARFLAPYTNKAGGFANVFGMLVRHMPLAEAWSTFGLYTLKDNQLDLVDREILILRTAVLIGSEYEWYQHEKIARRCGMSDRLIADIRKGTTPSPAAQLWINCANELVTDHVLRDETWQALLETFELSYVMDAIFTVGAYTTLGMALNSCGIEIEDQA